MSSFNQTYLKTSLKVWKNAFNKTREISSSILKHKKQLLLALSFSTAVGIWSANAQDQNIVTDTIESERINELSNEEFNITPNTERRPLDNEEEILRKTLEIQKQEKLASSNNWKATIDKRFNWASYIAGMSEREYEVLAYYFHREGSFSEVSHEEIKTNLDLRQKLSALVYDFQAEQVSNGYTILVDWIPGPDQTMPLIRKNLESKIKNPEVRFSESIKAKNTWDSDLIENTLIPKSEDITVMPASYEQAPKVVTQSQAKIEKAAKNNELYKNRIEKDFDLIQTKLNLEYSFEELFTNDDLLENFSITLFMIQEEANNWLEEGKKYDVDWIYGGQTKKILENLPDQNHDKVIVEENIREVEYSEISQPAEIHENGNNPAEKQVPSYQKFIDDMNEHIVENMQTIDTKLPPKDLRLVTNVGESESIGTTKKVEKKATNLSKRTVKWLKWSFTNIQSTINRNTAYFSYTIENNEFSKILSIANQLGTKDIKSSKQKSIIVNHLESLGFKRLVIESLLDPEISKQIDNICGTKNSIDPNFECDEGNVTGWGSSVRNLFGRSKPRTLTNIESAGDTWDTYLTEEEKALVVIMIANSSDFKTIKEIKKALKLESVKFISDYEKERKALKKQRKNAQEWFWQAASVLWLWAEIVKKSWSVQWWAGKKPEKNPTRLSVWVQQARNYDVNDDYIWETEYETSTEIISNETNVENFETNSHVFINIEENTDPNRLLTATERESAENLFETLWLEWVEVTSVNSVIEICTDIGMFNEVNIDVTQGVNISVITNGNWDFVTRVHSRDELIIRTPTIQDKKLPINLKFKVDKKSEVNDWINENFSAIFETNNYEEWASISKANLTHLYKLHEHFWLETDISLDREWKIEAIASFILWWFVKLTIDKSWDGKLKLFKSFSFKGKTISASLSWTDLSSIEDFVKNWYVSIGIADIFSSEDANKLFSERVTQLNEDKDLEDTLYKQYEDLSRTLWKKTSDKSWNIFYKNALYLVAWNSLKSTMAINPQYWVNLSDLDHITKSWKNFFIGLWINVDLKNNAWKYNDAYYYEETTSINLDASREVNNWVDFETIYTELSKRKDINVPTQNITLSIAWNDDKTNSRDKIENEINSKLSSWSHVIDSIQINATPDQKRATISVKLSETITSSLNDVSLSENEMLKLEDLSIKFASFDNQWSQTNIDAIINFYLENETQLITRLLEYFKDKENPALHVLNLVTDATFKNMELRNYDRLHNWQSIAERSYNKLVESQSTSRIFENETGINWQVLNNLEADNLTRLLSNPKSEEFKKWSLSIMTVAWPKGVPRKLIIPAGVAVPVYWLSEEDEYSKSVLEVCENWAYTETLPTLVELTLNKRRVTPAASEEGLRISWNQVWFTPGIVINESKEITETTVVTTQKFEQTLQTDLVTSNSANITIAGFNEWFNATGTGSLLTEAIWTYRVDPNMDNSNWVNDQWLGWRPDFHADLSPELLIDVHNGLNVINTSSPEYQAIAQNATWDFLTWTDIENNADRIVNNHTVQLGINAINEAYNLGDWAVWAHEITVNGETNTQITTELSHPDSSSGISEETMHLPTGPIHEPTVVTISETTISENSEISQTWEVFDNSIDDVFSIDEPFSVEDYSDLVSPSEEIPVIKTTVTSSIDEVISNWEDKVKSINNVGDKYDLYQALYDWDNNAAYEIMLNGNSDEFVELYNEIIDTEKGTSDWHGLMNEIYNQMFI